MTIIKICGLTRMEDVEASVDAGADMLGFVLCKSPRRAEHDFFARCSERVEGLASTVGVFAEIQDLRDFVAASPVAADYYQVYFDPPDDITLNPNIGWIRANWMEQLQVAPAPLENELVLYDFKHREHGEMSEHLSGVGGLLQSNVILAGNLAPDNVGDIVREFRPFAVDAARGTERSPGIKDHELIRKFIREVRNA